MEKNKTAKFCRKHKTIIIINGCNCNPKKRAFRESTMYLKLFII